MPDSDDILLESVVKRRGRHPRVSFDGGWKGEKNGFWPRGGDIYPENGASSVGLRGLGKRSSSILSLSPFEKAMTTA